THVRVRSKAGDDVVLAGCVEDLARDLDAERRRIGAARRHAEVDVEELFRVFGLELREEVAEPLERVLILVEPEEVRLREARRALAVRAVDEAREDARERRD